MKSKYLNIIFAALVIVFAAVFYFSADSFKMLPGQADIGPKAFPRGVSLCLIALSVMLIISELRKNDQTKIQMFNVKFFIGLATAILYVLLLRKVGFVICSMVAIFVMELLLLNEPVKKAMPLMLAVAVLFPLVLQILFGSFLKVPIPAGLLSFIF